MVVPQRVHTIVDGIKAKVSATTKVIYVKGCNVNDQDRSGFQAAVHAAKSADLTVLVMGEQARREGAEDDAPATDGEGYDVASLDFTGVQEDLVRAIQATGKPIVLVLLNGRPLSLRWEAEHVLDERWLDAHAGLRGHVWQAAVSLRPRAQVHRVPI